MTYWTLRTGRVSSFVDAGWASLDSVKHRRLHVSEADPTRSQAFLTSSTSRNQSLTRLDAIFHSPFYANLREMNAGIFRVAGMRKLTGNSSNSSLLFSRNVDLNTELRTPNNLKQF